MLLLAAQYPRAQAVQGQACFACSLLHTGTDGPLQQHTQQYAHLQNRLEAPPLSAR